MSSTDYINCIIFNLFRKRFLNLIITVPDRETCCKNIITRLFFDMYIYLSRNLIECYKVNVSNSNIKDTIIS